MLSKEKSLYHTLKELFASKKKKKRENRVLSMEADLLGSSLVGLPSAISLAILLYFEQIGYNIYYVVSTQNDSYIKPTIL